MAQYYTANPEFKLLNICEGEYNDETLLHKQFRKFQHRGEWFNYSEEIIQGFAKYKTRLDNFNLTEFSLNEEEPNLVEQDIILTLRGVKAISELSQQDLKLFMVFLKGISVSNILLSDYKTQRAIMSEIRKPVNQFNNYLQKLVDQNLIIEDDNFYRFNPTYVKIKIY